MSVLLFSLVSLWGCSVGIHMTPPTPSGLRYSARPQEPVKIVVRDSRSDKSLARGRIPANISGLGEGLTFLGDSLAAELRARGIEAVTVAADASGPGVLVVEVDRFYFRHHRVSGFSPWVTFTNFRARTRWQGTSSVVTSYFHAAKVPQWSMSEIVEPNYNYPLGVLVKEVATKLNRLYFHGEPPADDVRRKVAAAEKGENLDAIMDLAFLGSPDALPTLETLVKSSTSGNVVTYALDAIGVIGDARSFPFLRSYYASARDRGKMMSLKAIGDLGTPESLQFVRGADTGRDENLKEIVSLYTY